MSDLNTEPKQADGVMNQVIIYSKGHYKQTDDPIADLTEVIAQYTGTDPSYITEKDVQANIIGAFCHYVKPMAQIEALTRGLGVTKLFPNQEPDIYSNMLGKLSIILGKYVNTDEKLDISFDKK